jgi:hypothetical protein
VTRLMIDGINTDAATMAQHMNGVSLVAGYDDGLYKWSAADWAMFPHAIHVHIVVHTATNSGHVLDVESGNDVTPSHWISWVQMRRAAGADPTIYTGQNTYWSAVRSAFQSAGVAEPHYWVANYSNGTAIPSGAVAFQYADVGPYDESTVADYWPGVDPAPPPPIPSEADMPFIAQFNPDPQNPNAGSGIFLIDGGKLLAFATPASALAFKSALGLSWVTVTDGATLANFNADSAESVINISPAEIAALGADIGAAIHIPTHLTGTETTTVTDTLS